MIIKINGTDRTQEIDRESFSLEWNVSSKVDVARFRYNKTAGKSYSPSVTDVVEVYKDGVMIWAGQITEHRASVVGDVGVYEIVAKSWEHLLDKKLVADNYQNQDIAQTVRDILSGIPDISEGNIVDTNIILSGVSFNYVKPSDAIRSLAEYAGFDWWINPDKTLDFVPRGDNRAPFDCRTDDADTIISFSLLKNDSQLRNVIYVIGSDYVGNTTTDTLSRGDGQRKRFTLPYVYDTKPTVKLNGVTQTVGVEGLDDPTQFDCLWNRNEKIIVFPTAPADGATIEVTGDPLLPLLVKMKAPDTSKGEFEHRIIDRSLKTKDAVRRRARAEIDAYSQTITEATFSTYRDGLKAGQKIYVYSSALGISAEKYIIQQVRMTPHGQRWRYDVKLANVKAFEIIELMRLLLLQDERVIGGLGDASETVDTIMTFYEQIQTSEQWRVNRGRRHLNDTVSMSQVVKVRKNYNRQWVWGDYTPTGIDDPKRVPMWDRGATWA